MPNENAKNTPYNNLANNAIQNGKKSAKKLNKSLDNKAVVVGKAINKLTFKPLNKNIYKDLTPEEHRLALIKSCVDGNSIFEDSYTDPPEKYAEDMKDYMFYQHLYLLAAAQMTQPSENGSLLPGLIGGLSMIAGAALFDERFRSNLVSHVEDKLQKYVEPFKDENPKLWHQLSAKVEAHPGCASPESIAIKLLRYQKQANNAVKSGVRTVKEVDDQLQNKCSELKSAASNMGIAWSDVVKLKNQMAKDLSVMDNIKYGEQFDSISSELNRDSDDLSDASEFEIPIDIESAARKLMTYQNQLREAVNGLHENGVLPDKYADIAKPPVKESDVFASAINEVAELKFYTEKVLGLKWDDVATRYNEMNEAEYDRLNKNSNIYKECIDEANRQEILPDGSKNPNYGKVDMAKYKKLKHDYNMQREAAARNGQPMPYGFPMVSMDGKLHDFIEYDARMKEHNERMYYELPVDSKSAGRCLKKYQQDAYENVRHNPNRQHSERAYMSSNDAYALSNALCKNIKVASDVLKFDWKSTIREYRKDVYDTVRKDKSKRLIWSDMVNGDIIDNIQSTSVIYETDENGIVSKKTVPLSRQEQIAAWDGTLYDKNGNKIPDDKLMQIRNPYTEDDATNALYATFINDLKLELQIKSLREENTYLDDNGEEKIKPQVMREIITLENEQKDLQDYRKNLLDSFQADHFPPELINKVKEKAEAWFDDSKEYMRGDENALDKNQTDKNQSKIPEVKLDESLLPAVYGDDEDENEFESPDF